MSDNDERERRTVIGGRYGSPTVTVALPFARITRVDTDLRDAVADLASLVARLAEHWASGDTTELDAVREAATELAGRLESPRA